MGVLSAWRSEIGQVSVAPGTVKIVTTDNLATVTAAGYFNNQPVLGINLLPSDILQILYSYNVSTGSGSFEFFTISISNGVITASAFVSSGNVLLPVVSGDFAVFNGVSGQIKDSGSLPSVAAQPYVVMSPGGLTIGNFPQIGDAHGTITNGIPPSASGQAFVAMSPGGVTAGHLVKFNDANGTLADSGAIPANLIQTSAPSNTQSIAGNLLLNSNPVVVNKTVTATFTALATAGKVNIFVAPTVTAQIAILDIKVFLSTGLSGGGGNRLLSLADGTLVFNTTGITAALLGTPIFTLWGGTGNPIPSASEASISTAGANVYLQYVGGTTDYTAGSVIISVTYAQVTT